MKPAPPLQLWPCHYTEWINAWYVGVRLDLPHEGRPWWRNDELVQRTGHETLEALHQLFPQLRQRLWTRFAHYVRFRQACPEFPVQVWHSLFAVYGQNRHAPIETIEDFVRLDDRDLARWTHVGPVTRRYLDTTRARLVREACSAGPEWDAWAEQLERERDTALKIKW